MPTRFEYIKDYEQYLPTMMETDQSAVYIRQVYDYLELMDVNTKIKLQADSEKLPYLLVAVGAFLNAQDHWMDFELNDDYTWLRRKPLSVKFRKLMRQ